jgi:hypothetical protein
VCWITWRTRRKKRFSEIAMHEGDARCNATTQRIRARGEGDGKRTAPGTDLSGVQWVRCTAECAIGGNAVGKKCERGFNDELALWPWVEHIGGDEQLEPAEAATSSEVTDRSTRCALLHECGECCGCITR